MGRLPAQHFAGLVVRGRVVQAGEGDEEAEVLRRFLVGDALGLDPELAGDRLGDQLARDARVTDAVEGRARRGLLQRQAVEHADVVRVGRRPAVAAVAGVGRDAVLTGEVDQCMREAVMVEIAVHHRREPHDGRAHALLG